MSETAIKSLIMYLAGISNIMLGSFILFNGIGKEKNRAFFLFTASLGVWSIALSSFLLANDNNTAYIYILVVTASLFTIPTTFYNLSSAFSGNKYCLRIRPVYILMIILLLLSFIYFPRFYIQRVISHDWGKESVLGLGYWLLSFYYMGIIVLGFYKLYLSFKNRELGPRDIQTNKYIFFSILATLLFGSIFDWLFPLLNYYPDIWIGPFALFIAVATITYSIVKQRLLDIPVIISKTSARIITYLFFSGVYISIILFYFNFISMKPDWLFIAFTVAFGILGVESAAPTRLAIQTTTDKLFLRGKYDYYYELEHIGNDLANSAGFDELLTYLNDAFINNLEVGRPRLFIPKDDKTGDFYAWDLIEKKATPETIPRGSFIFEYFSEVKTVIEKGFEGSERLDRAFDETGAKLLIPCYFRNKLLGILAFGDKLSQEEFTDEDIHLLKSISNQIGAALERAGAYEDLKAEVEKARAQMEISSRLSSLGTLAAGVTHEIRNPLAVIQSKLELLPDKLDDKEFLKNLSEVLPRHIERIVGLINRLLFFAKPEKHMTQKINICQVLQDTIDLVDGEAARRDIKIVKDLKDLEIMGDFSQLSQVFLNIMLNAVQSMGSGGEMRVSTSTSNGWVAATISDTGPGIAPENLSKIFDPFFTTRPSGTGLGLAITRRIVEEHKGEISVVSEPGKGAVFTVKLPAY